MGCVNSKPDINDQHPNIFQVTNVNDQGDLVSPGQLEITETELVLYQRGKSPTIWPLRSLRKYGFDSGIFSFECGRRCPTGEGIYAFQCRKAEQLFNIVQQHIVRNSEEPELAVQRRLPAQPESYLNPVRPTLSRPNSVTNNGQISPVSPPPDFSFEHNNNKNDTNADKPNYANLDVSPNVPENYINVDSPCRLYMNVNTEPPSEEDTKHCYANIDTKELEHLKATKADLNVPQTVTSLYITIHEVNYAELDLDKGAPVQSDVQTVVPDSPSKTKESYATIDFQKTNALSQSINPARNELEEGSRKTRHNSTISDITTRNSSSLSE